MVVKVAYAVWATLESTFSPRLVQGRGHNMWHSTGNKKSLNWRRVVEYWLAL